MNETIKRAHWLVKVNAVISTRGWHDPISYELLSARRFTIVEVAKYRAEFEDAPVVTEDFGGQPAPEGKGTFVETLEDDGHTEDDTEAGPVDPKEYVIEWKLDGLSNKELKGFVALHGLNVKVDARYLPKANAALVEAALKMKADKED